MYRVTYSPSFKGRSSLELKIKLYHDIIVMLLPILILLFCWVLISEFFYEESSVSRGNWDCLIPLPHRVRSETFMILNLVGCKYILYHVCVDRCLSRLDNPTRIWKLKLENKDLLFVAFQQKKPQSLHKLCMSRATIYPLTGQSC